MNTEERIAKLEKDLQDLIEEVYNKNFSSFQEFSKFSDFTNRIKVPVFASLPTTGRIGELCVVSGKLYVCSAANTFSLVGTQS